MMGEGWVGVTAALILWRSPFARHSGSSVPRYSRTAIRGSPGSQESGSGEPPAPTIDCAARRLSRRSTSPHGRQNQRYSAPTALGDEIDGVLFGASGAFARSFSRHRSYHGAAFWLAHGRRRLGISSSDLNWRTTSPPPCPPPSRGREIRRRECAALPFRQRVRATASGVPYRGRRGSGRRDRAPRRRPLRGSA